MNLSNCFHLSPEVANALRKNNPVVAMESTSFLHGFAYPDNINIINKIQELVASNGAVLAITAVIDGVLKVGLSKEETALFFMQTNLPKISRRDLPIFVATKQSGATTVASAMILCSLAGIKILCASGIGGVGHSPKATMDISADLQELRQTPVAVVCSGIKPAFSTGNSLEYLETMGVPIVGFKCEAFPDYFCLGDSFGVDYTATTYEQVAQVVQEKWNLGLKGGTLIANPIQSQLALPWEPMQQLCENALQMAKSEGVHGKDLVGYINHKIFEYTKGESARLAQEMLCSNAILSAQIACVL